MERRATAVLTWALGSGLTKRALRLSILEDRLRRRGDERRSCDGVKAWMQCSDMNGLVSWGFSDDVGGKNSDCAEAGDCKSPRLKRESH